MFIAASWMLCEWVGEVLRLWRPPDVHAETSGAGGRIAAPPPTDPHRSRYIEQIVALGAGAIVLTQAICSAGAAVFAGAMHAATVALRRLVAPRSRSVAPAVGIDQGPGGHASYRPDIDGLRALAIIPVVLFHAEVAGFEGGYVGVDIFFVISGYLITCLIQREMDQGAFSFVRFWERRARRILPALIVVVLFSLIAGWFILIPSDLENLGRSAFAQSLFASNILFWMESGYFDIQARSKPLLHTWSLAVEEQFYLLFPIALFLVTMVGRSFRVLMIAIGLLCSFALSVWGVANYPDATFYLLPTRAWELLLGSLLALAAASGTIGSFRYGEILSWLGLAAIGIAVFGYDQETPFPGLAALLPCLGTAAIIWANESRLTSLGRLLSVAPLVHTGLISYSLYLWHWPLIVFAEYASFDELSASDKSVILAFSVVVAWLSWKFIENPIRRRAYLTRRPQLAGAAAAGVAVAAALGLSGDVTSGYPSRLPPDALRYAAGAVDHNPRRDECHSTSLELAEQIEPCRLGDTASDEKPALLVWGDSHADAFMPILDTMAGKFSTPAWFRSYSGCAPIREVFSPGNQNHECPEFNDRVLELAKEHDIEHVALIANWTLYTEGQESGETSWLISDAQSKSDPYREARIVFEKRFKETINTLLRHGFIVWIVKQVPLQRFLPPIRLSQVALYGGDPASVGRPLSEHMARQSFVNSVMEGIEHDRVNLLDPAEYLCAQDGLCKAARYGHSLYRDEHHLSRFGSLQMRPMFERMFSSIAGEN